MRRLPYWIILLLLVGMILFTSVFGPIVDVNLWPRAGDIVARGGPLLGGVGCLAALALRLRDAGRSRWLAFFPLLFAVVAPVAGALIGAGLWAAMGRNGDTILAGAVLGMMAGAIGALGFCGWAGLLPSRLRT